MHRLWRLRKQDRFVDAQISDEGDAGVEIAYFYNHQVAYRRRWSTREAALADADAKRRELEREGWMMHW
jgi:hypothetical protein